MSATDRISALAQALALSRDTGLPWFVYRKRLPPPPFVITADESAAKAFCDDDGYERCDARTPRKDSMLWT